MKVMLLISPAGWTARWPQSILSIVLQPEVLRMCKDTFVLIPYDKEIHAIIEPSLLIVDKSWQIAFRPELKSLFSGGSGQQERIHLLIELL